MYINYYKTIDVFIIFILVIAIIYNLWPRTVTRYFCIQDK